MEDRVQVRCTRCKGLSRERANRIEDGFSRRARPVRSLLFFTAELVRLEYQTGDARCQGVAQESPPCRERAPRRADFQRIAAKFQRTRRPILIGLRGRIGTVSNKRRSFGCMTRARSSCVKGFLIIGMHHARRSRPDSWRILQVRLKPRCPISQFMSVHARHVDVSDEYRDLGIGFQDVDRFATAARRDYIAAEVFQHV